MVFIRIERKLQICAAVIILVGSIGFNIYSHVRNTRLTNNYMSLMCIVSQVDKTDLVPFVVLKETAAKRSGKIEIFDISQGKVIQEIQSNSSIQKDVKGYINGITGLYIKVKAFPEQGIIIWIPLEPAVKIKSRWLKAQGINNVDEVFILFPHHDAPYLLILDEKERPLFYNFEGNTDILLEKLNLKLESVQANP